jgi:RNA polymerase sigma factor (sigma-70 family)
MTTSRETAAIVALLRRRDLLAGEVADLVEDHGSAVLALEHVLSGGDREPQLFTDEADAPEPVDLDAIEAEVEQWKAEGMTLTTVLDPEYLENLHTVHNRPPLLFVCGALLPSDERSIAVVGTRKATPEGAARAGKMARALCAYDTASLETARHGEDAEAPLIEMLGCQEGGYHRVETRAVLDDMLRSLPLRQRAAVRLRFEDDLTQREIGQRMGISQMQVSRLLRASLTQLREVLPDEVATDVRRAA